MSIFINFSKINHLSLDLNFSKPKLKIKITEIKDWSFEEMLDKNISFHKISISAAKSVRDCTILVFCLVVSLS